MRFRRSVNKKLVRSAISGIVLAAITFTSVVFIFGFDSSFILFLVGLLLLLFVGGAGNVRTSGVGGPSHRGRIESAVVDRNIDQRKNTRWDRYIIFYALGLIFISVGSLLIA